MDELLTGLRMPPLGELEHQFLKRFMGEWLRAFRTRIEYPLLLAAAGVRQFKPTKMTDKYCAAQIADEWQRYREGCVAVHQISAPTDLLERAYSRADRRAPHLPQTYPHGPHLN